MNTDNELPLATTQRMDVAPVDPPGQVSIAQMFQAVIQSGDASKNAAAIQTLAELKWKEEERQAGREYAAAFSALQRDIPRIRAVHIVPDKQGNKKFKVAKFEEIMDQLIPLLKSHSFAISFPQKYEEGTPLRITVICQLQHIASGHVTQTPFTVRVGNGPPGCGESQADGAASSYAKMRALCAALNIVIEQAIGDDAGALGDTTTKITAAQATELEHRTAMLEWSKSVFFDMAGSNVKSFADIAAQDYERLNRLLQRKEKGGK